MASIVAKPGREFLLKVASSSASPTVFVTVGGLRNVTLNGQTGAVDITNDASNGWQEFLGNGGTRKMDISADGIFNTSDTGFNQLNAAFINQTTIECQVISGHGDSWSGDFVVTNLTRSGPVDQAETFTVALSSSGPLSYDA